MSSDLKSALRQIVKSPGYTAIVVLTLAFGIAVNTQIFGIVSAFFLQPMPVRDADRLVVTVARSSAFNMPHGLSFIDFEDIRSGSKAMTDHVAFFFTPAHLSVAGQTPERVWVETVTPNAFSKMGVTTVLGRPLQPADGEKPPAAPVAVLTHRYWQSHFGGDPGIVGRTILLNSRPFTVVGVAQPGFDSFSWSMSMALFVPSGALPILRPGTEAFFQYRSAAAWRVLSYLKPGTTLADANAELAVFAQRFVKDFPDDHRNFRFQAVPEQRARPDPIMTDFMPVFTVLFVGLVVLVLVIACANVANLMIARGALREKELVVRSALGASRARLFRQLLCESLVLAILAGVVGYTIALIGRDILSSSMPVNSDFPIKRSQSESWQVVAFTAAISLAAGLASGLLPALRASRVDLNDGLKQGAGRSVSGRHRLRNLLVIGQVAVSCVVLIASGIFLRSLREAQHLSLGFNPERLLLSSFDLSLQNYDEARGLAFQRRLLEQVRALPGVESAGLTQHVPFNYNIQIRDIWPDNPTGAVPEGHTTMAMSSVDPGFLAMFGVKVTQGRDFAASDDERGAKVAIVNEAMARLCWPDRSPLGEHIRFWRGGPAYEVVGVVPTGKYVMLSEPPRPFVYLSSAQSYAAPITLVVRAATDPHGLAKSVRDTVRALDPDLPVFEAVTLEEHLATSAFAFMPMRIGATLAGIQGAIGLVLAILGLYAVVSYGVTTRTREIGVRMALGATDAEVLRLVSREGLRLTLIGAGIGLVLATGMSLGLSRVLFGAQPFDFIAFPTVLLLVCGVAAFACYWPARRAARIDPMQALRSE